MRLLFPFIRLLLAISFFITVGCGGSEDASRSGRLLFPDLGYPSVIEHGGMFYFTCQSTARDSIFLYASPTVEGLAETEGHFIWTPERQELHNIWSPELSRIGDAWYMYFEADDGRNTDNHQLYVLENRSADPMAGTWRLHGPILTSDEWNFGLHPSTFILDGRQYLLWSGWPKRRTEEETQVIYIAEMENPWTLMSERVMISRPEYEWERQWINPDGSRSAYPIFVNENPEAVVSPDGGHVVVAYSASGIWTDFLTLGLLHASADSDLLDPLSWTKEPEPFFTGTVENRPLKVSNVSFVRKPDDKERQYVLYEVKKRDEGGWLRNEIRWKEIAWTPEGLPDLGNP